MYQDLSHELAYIGEELGFFKIEILIRQLSSEPEVERSCYDPHHTTLILSSDLLGCTSYIIGFFEGPLHIFHTC